MTTGKQPFSSSNIMFSAYANLVLDIDAEKCLVPWHNEWPKLIRSKSYDDFTSLAIFGFGLINLIQLNSNIID